MQNVVFFLYLILLVLVMFVLVSVFVITLNYHKMCIFLNGFIFILLIKGKIFRSWPLDPSIFLCAALRGQSLDTLPWVSIYLSVLKNRQQQKKLFGGRLFQSAAAQQKMLLCFSAPHCWAPQRCEGIENNTCANVRRKLPPACKDAQRKQRGHFE